MKTNMQARILEKSEENLWADFIQNHPLATIHQTPQWGHFQGEIPSRGKYWIVVLEDSRKVSPGIDLSQTANIGSTSSHSQILAGDCPSTGAGQAQYESSSSQAGTPPKILAGTLLIRHKLPKGYSWLYAARGPLLDYASAKRERAASAQNLALPVLSRASSTNKTLAEEQMSVLLATIKKIAKQEKAIFLRIDPPLVSQSASANTAPAHAASPSEAKSARADFLPKQTAQESHLFSANSVPASTRLPDQSPAPGPYSSTAFSSHVSSSAIHFPGFHPTSHGFQPQHTIILDLTKTEPELLSQMKPKGRYNIKIAAQKGVKIRLACPAVGRADPHDHEKFHHDISSFYKIFQETARRDGFHGHNQDYYEKMLKNLNPAAALYLAELDGQVLAASIIIYFANTATYYFGASSSADRNIMAPYLLHWQAIKDAKAKGYKFYDFFGIAPKDAKNHPWSGVTQFKKKFGGNEISYQPAREFPFKKLFYKAYKLYKKFF